MRPWAAGSLRGNRFLNNIVLRDPDAPNPELERTVLRVGQGGSTLTQFENAYGPPAPGEPDPVADNLQANPLFTDEAGGDFTLRQGSPAIDRGMVITGAEVPDGEPDIGAYEFSGAGITAVNLTNGSSGVDGAVYTTAPITPGANRLLLLAVYGQRADGNPLVAPTIAGNGLTWEPVALIAGPTGNTTRGLVVFRAMGSSPGSGSITITWPGTMNYCFWSVNEFDGVATGGTNGAAAIVQAATGESQATGRGEITLAPFANAVSNAAFGVFVHHAANPTTPESGYAELSDQVAAYEFPRGVAEEWSLGQDTLVTATWPGTPQYVGIALEIAASVTP